MSFHLNGEIGTCRYTYLPIIFGLVVLSHPFPISSLTPFIFLLWTFEVDLLPLWLQVNSDTTESIYKLLLVALILYKNSSQLMVRVKQDELRSSITFADFF